MNKKRIRTKLIAGLVASVALFMQPCAWSEQYAANFKGTDIQEFINIVGKNLNKTIIVDPTVRGKINVRSYDMLNDQQYYQFFLNVLQVYGYAVVEMDNNVIKVVKDKDAKVSSIRLANDNAPGLGDEMVTRIVALYNTEAKQLAPLLRQLNDNAGGGNVVNYDPSNVIMITGRAAVVNKLVDIVKQVDKQGDVDTQVVQLKYASAGEIVRIIDNLYRSSANQAQMPGQAPKVVADERTNAVVVSGDKRSRERAVELISRLDAEQATTGNTKVRYLKYAKAKDLVEVLTGFAQKLQSKEGGAASSSPSAAGAAGARNNNITIMAHEETNSLVISAEPDQMRTLDSVIDQLDIRRAQVLVEAIIVELSENDSIGLGVQMGSLSGGLTQFNNVGSTISDIGAGIWSARTVSGSTTTTATSSGVVTTTTPDTYGDTTALASALSNVSGMAWAVVSGDFGALIQATAADTNSNVLATPSITTMDNQEASFIVGDEVPVITGSQSSQNGNSNPFTTVERKEVGVKLKVVPQINEGNSVKLTIEQEVSGVNGNTSVDVTFATRKLSTTVMADSGQIVVLGGLINKETQESVQKVPLLGDIPFLGQLFRSSNSKTVKKNLMVFIRPTIIREGVVMEGIAGRKYNYFRALQLEQQQRGVNLMPDAEVPVMDKLTPADQIPPEVNKLLEQYKSGKALNTDPSASDSHQDTKQDGSDHE
ncbi:type II secretion system secretin GspD [Shewanella yunxiaonensis]|uniref:Type II secretion system secretin GspD n=1 Tax=Shewanella yunxiaonensis TaxID=2829809 RepID=A0ABX7YTK1_9GAMM|nr:type II secretion system secretin GspD [Shewanella yunxiaonensis]QUN06042.1 type II secretion system secretin GspD [Shewanella yunxiaonensis]